MKAWLGILFCIATCTLLSSCGDETETTTGCPNIARNWTVADHCDPTLVGSGVTVTQNGCAYTVEEWAFSGTIAGDGSLSSNGVLPGGAQLACTGKGTATEMTLTCSNGCDVRLTP